MLDVFSGFWSALVVLGVVFAALGAGVAVATEGPGGLPLDPDAMSVHERAEWIGHAQRGHTSSSEERAIVDLFLRTKGLALTELKDRVDAGDDHRDLHQLVYHDLDDEGLRSKLISHVRRESAAVREKHGDQGIKLLSDIDDTIYPNFADRRSWSMDDAPYPGVIEFYEALTGPVAPGRSRLTLVSARPYERSGELKKQSGRKLRKMQLPPHSILSGNAWTLLSVLPGDAGEKAISEIGAEKLRNFEQWSELMGEYDFIISGDRTQADHVFAANALRLAGGRVRAAFIHDVGDRPRENASRLFYNETVLGHAIDAHDGGWIDRAGLQRVRDAIVAGKAAGFYPPELESPVVRDLARAAKLLSVLKRP